MDNEKTKGFMDIPAARFLKAEEPKPAETTPADDEAAGQYQFRKQRTYRRTRPEYVETRSKRRQILVLPSLDAQCEAIAVRDEISFNQVVERALTEYIERHGTRGE